MTPRCSVQCPSCRMDALMCIGKEMRTGGPCCADCRMQEVQQPMHVWPPTTTTTPAPTSSTPTTSTPPETTATEVTVTTDLTVTVESEGP